MFTRNSPATPKHEPNSVARGGNGAFSAAGPETHEKSVIGNDLKIIGQGLKIIGRGVLQVDGEIEGDVQAAEVIVGEKGQVTGMVAGRQVVVRGKVSGIVAERPLRCRLPRKSMATSTTCRYSSSRVQSLRGGAAAPRASKTSMRSSKALVINNRLLAAECDRQDMARAANLRSEHRRGQSRASRQCSCC